MADNNAEIIGCTSLKLASIGAASAILARRNEKRRHKVWIQKYLKDRENVGTFNALLPEISVCGKYCQYLRIYVDTFEELYLYWLSQILSNKR